MMLFQYAIKSILQKVATISLLKHQLINRSPQILLVLITLWAGWNPKAIAQQGGGGGGPAGGGGGGGLTGSGGGGGGPTGSGGEFTIDFSAAAPNTYNHQTGGGAFNDGTAGVDDDKVESLEGGDFACQDTVTYLAEIVVGSGLPIGNANTIELDLEFLADSTGQPGVGHDEITNVAINYGQVENGDRGTGSNPGVGNFGTDSGINDDGGSTATLISQTVSNPPPLEGNGSVLTGKIQIDDLEADETVILRVDVSLSCAPDTSPTGNIQGSLADATVVDDGSAIPGGVQTIPFKQIGNIAGAGEPLLEFQKTVTTDLTGSDTVGSKQITATQGDTVRYLYKVSNLGTSSLFDLQITDDNGTPGDASDDFTVDTNNILGDVVNLADVDGDADRPELRSVTEVVLYADVPLANAGTIANTATAAGESGDGGNAATLTVTDTAQVVVEAANFASPTIDLDGDDSSAATNNDFNTSYTLGGSAVKVVDADNADEALDTVIADSDSTQLSEAVITLTNDPSIAGDSLSIDATALNAIALGAISADTSVANQITLSGNADIADYEAALELIEFSTTSTDTTSRTVTVRVTDTDAQVSNVATTNISVSAPSQPGKDYGDAPDSYKDASHDFTASPDLYLGSIAPDGETETLGTSSNSTGDDDANIDDEDAFIALPNILIADPSIPDLSLGRKYSLNVPVTNNTGGEATLHAWIDFNKNGKFEEGEYQTVPVNGEDSVSLSWDIPVGTSIGDTHARFRLTTDDLGGNQRLLSFFNLGSIPILSVLNSTILNLLDGIDGRSVGNAVDGEVEDYPVSISLPLYDYGDAPDSSSGTLPGDYQTTQSDGGPSHIIVDTLGLGFSLGSKVDGDDGSLEDENADADDLNGETDDEDGVDLANLPPLTADAGQTYTIPVTVRNTIPLLNGYLKGYIDFNRDGDFNDAGEQSVTVTVPPITSVEAGASVTGSSASASASVNENELRTVNLSFTVPAGVTPGATYARFRLGSIKNIVESATTVSVSALNGEVNNGEVEDYKIEIAEATNSGNTESTDYGDAPDPYQPASHDLTADSDLYIGNVPPDGEADTQLTSAASAGDDDDGNDDEDAFVALPNFPLLDPSITDLSLGRSYELKVPVTNNTGSQATLHAWIDFNQNNKFESGEYQSALVNPNANEATLSWNVADILGLLDALNVPLDTLAGDTHARFRLTTDDLSDTARLLDIVPLLGEDERSLGNASDGEVEDHPISISLPLYDYGDAPDTGTGTGKGNYRTTERDGGPTHIVIQDPLDLLHLSLGNNIDADEGNLQNENADADDTNTQNDDLLNTIISNGDTERDDEDGVVEFPLLTAEPGQIYTVPVTVRNNVPALNAYLKGYIDFNQDGDFDDPGEKSATVTVPSDLLTVDPSANLLGIVGLDTSAPPRTFNVEFTVPNNVVPGNTYARFRLGSIQEIVESATSLSVSTSNGEVNNGEVEDYGIAIAPTTDSLAIDLDGDDGSATDNADTLYVLGGSAVKLIEDSADESRDTVITTPNGIRLSRMVVTFINIPPIAGDEITIDPAAVDTISSGRITTDLSVANQIVLNGNADADAADFEAALELIEFKTALNSTDDSDRIISIQVFDNDPQTNAAPVRVNIDVLEIPAVECEYCTNN